MSSAFLNILLVCPDEKDATSFYRGWGPFGELAQNSNTPIFLHRIPLLNGSPQIGWSTVADKQLVFLQRPCQQAHIEVLKICRQAGATVRSWVDWDDLLWKIPHGNPAKAFYGNEDEVKAAMLACVQMADIITVSTEFFRTTFPEELQSKIQVLRNRLPKRWQCCHAHQKPGERIKIAWRGSRTHDLDWIDFLPEVVRLSEQEPIDWYIIGSAPPHVLEALSNTTQVFYYPEIPMERYFEWFIKEGPQADILFVPLRDHIFNRAKSHIALLEATMAGMLCVGPAWPEWKTPEPQANRLLYHTPDQIFSCLQTACEQSRKGAFTLIQQLQAYFLQQYQEEQQKFQDLVFA